MENYYTQSDFAPREENTQRPYHKGHKKWILIVFLAAVVIVAACVAAAVYLPTNLEGQIDIIRVEGEISDYGSTGIFSSYAYDHQYTLNKIDSLTESNSNRGILLYVDSPGGGVMESDEVYLKLLDYKEKTGRPIYAYFASQAASGGYYISMAADHITCNRNCMTGSIGVRLNTLLDMTGLLEKLGIKAVTITSGENKAMGDSYTELTEEQRQILQDYIDESYAQFVEIVAQGRNMTTEEVRVVADGRIYSAKQALNARLVDEIGTLEDALASMKENCGLEGCRVEDPAGTASSWGSLFSQLKQLRPKNEVESLTELIQSYQHGAYYCDITALLG